MKPFTPKKVYRIALKTTIKAINKQLRKQRKLIHITGESVDSALRELQDNKKLCEDVKRRFEKVGWFVEFKGIKYPQSIFFRTEPKKE